MSDRNKRKSGSVGKGNHRESKQNGKIRANAGSGDGKKRTKKKSKSVPQKAAPVKAPAEAAKPIDFNKQWAHEQMLIERARMWAKLHRNSDTRAQMDALLNGLSAADQRRVYLCGQRIVGGLSFKLIK